VKPGEHVHVNAVAVVPQTPMFWQGEESQLLAVASQLVPRNPAVQAQKYSPGTGVLQAALFWHGAGPHSSMSVSQLVPSKPIAHWQV